MSIIPCSLGDSILLEAGSKCDVPLWQLIWSSAIEQGIDCLILILDLPDLFTLYSIGLNRSKWPKKQSVGVYF